MIDSPAPSPGSLLLPTADLPQAARLYLAALAYPEGGPGRDRFAQALFDHHVHSVMQSQDRSAALAVRPTGDGRPIRRALFQKRLDHGCDRIARSLAVLQLYGLRQRLAWGKCEDTTPEAINAAVPTWTDIIRGEPDDWKARLALNATGPGGDDERDRVKKLNRTIRACSRVLPLAHGLAKAGPAAEEPGQAAFRAQLLTLAADPDSWLVEAVGLAQFYPELPYPRGGEAELAPDSMIRVLWCGPDGFALDPGVTPLQVLPPRIICKPRPRRPKALAA